MYVLYYYPGNANLAPHMLLEELGVPYRLELVDREQGAHKSAEYLRLNPAGLIPVLVEGNLILPETAAICLHLVDQHPEAGLAPRVGTVLRAHFYRWLVYLTNTLQSRILVGAYSERLSDDEGGAAAVQRHAREQVSESLDLLEKHLASGGPWLLGEQFSALDLYLFTLCRWTRNLPSPARARPNLKRLLEATISRPAVRRAHEQEELAAPFY
jgi:glutathione S-transferase